MTHVGPESGDEQQNGPKIVIGPLTIEDWPGGSGPQTVTPMAPNVRDQRHRFSFRARLDPGGSELWFWTPPEAVPRMREATATERGARLVEALLEWIREDPEHRQLHHGNDFLVDVSETGDTSVVPTRPDL